MAFELCMLLVMIVLGALLITPLAYVLLYEGKQPDSQQARLLDGSGLLRQCALRHEGSYVLLGFRKSPKLGSGLTASKRGLSASTGLGPVFGDPPRVHLPALAARTSARTRAANLAWLRWHRSARRRDSSRSCAESSRACCT